MLSKTEKIELKRLLKEYSLAEIRIHSMQGLEPRKKAIADASTKLEAVFDYIDKEI